MVYVYDWKPIREIVIIGELLAVSAIVMCTLFVMVDIGQPAANTSRPASLTEHGIRLRLFLAFFEARGFHPPRAPPGCHRLLLGLRS